MLKGKLITKIVNSAVKTPPRSKFKLKKGSSLVGSIGLALGANATLHFVQYSRVFTALKRVLKKESLERMRFKMEQFRLAAITKHASKARMGKGRSRLDSYA